MVWLGSRFDSRDRHEMARYLLLVYLTLGVSIWSQQKDGDFSADIVLLITTSVLYYWENYYYLWNLVNLLASERSDRASIVSSYEHFTCENAAPVQLNDSRLNNGLLYNSRY